MALRTFTSRDGTVWNVWNVVPTLARSDRLVALGTGMTEGWLCFESPTSKRRVIPTPTEWEGWSDQELERALAGAQEVKRGSTQQPQPQVENGAGH